MYRGKELVGILAACAGGPLAAPFVGVTQLLDAVIALPASVITVAQGST